MKRHSDLMRFGCCFVYCRQNNLTITYHQFWLNLTMIYHKPNEVMRGCGLLPQKKSEKVRDNNLTQWGYGTLNVYTSFEMLRN